MEKQGYSVGAEQAEICPTTRRKLGNCVSKGNARASLRWDVLISTKFQATEGQL